MLRAARNEPSPTDSKRQRGKGFQTSLARWVSVPGGRAQNKAEPKMILLLQNRLDDGTITLRFRPNEWL
jgi:hypothetical protein